MTKGMWEIKAVDAVGNIRVFKNCASTLDILEQSFYKEYPTAIIITHKLLYTFED